MAKLNWNSEGIPSYETGVDRGVLYVDGIPGVVWNGLVGVTESSSGGSPRAYYIDGVKYLNLSSVEEFTGTIEAYYSPPQFDVCDGAKWVNQKIHVGMQNRKSFGFSYRTKTATNHKLHLIYNALASPTDRVHATLDASAEAPTLAWSITTRSVPAQGLAHTAHITINREKANPEHLDELELILYGSPTTHPRLPSANEVLAIFDANVSLIVWQHGDGLFTVSGPDEMVEELPNGQFRLRAGSIDAIVGGDYIINYTPTRRRA